MSAATLTVVPSEQAAEATRFMQAYVLETRHWQRGRLVAEMVRLAPKINDDSAPTDVWETNVRKFDICSERVAEMDERKAEAAKIRKGKK